MNEKEREESIIRYYNRLEKFGPVVQALGWRDAAQQKLRFQVLVDCIQLDRNTSVLDVGCGFGDLYDYLKSKNSAVIYEGCDISSDIVGIARKLHPDIKFKICDLRENVYAKQSFDYVCISGIFNYKISDNEKFLQDTLIAAYSICKKGVIINMTTDKVDFEDPSLHYYNPGSVIDFCSSLTRSLIIRHDYPLFEFTVGLYRSQN